MGDVITAFLSSFRDLARPRLWALMMAPFLGSFILWGFLTWLLWDVFEGWGLMLYKLSWMQQLAEWLAPYFILTENPLVVLTVAIVLVMGVLPAALVTAVLITSIFLVPVLVQELRTSEFQQITKKSGSFLEGTGTSLLYSLKYLFTWIVSLPLWILIPAGPVIIPFLLLAWFNSRILTWEVLTEVGTAQENQRFLHDHSKELFVLGLLSAFFYYIPVINFVAPVIASAAYARFCLTKLAKAPY
ncbi:MAG: EI24 domain-containing protein [Bdellovibrionales bacterium]